MVKGSSDLMALEDSGRGMCAARARCPRGPGSARGAGGAGSRLPVRAGAVGFCEPLPGVPLTHGAFFPSLPPSPYIIGTMSQATSSTPNLQLHHNFR